MCSLVRWWGVGPREREQKRDQQRGDQDSCVQRGNLYRGEHKENLRRELAKSRVSEKNCKSCAFFLEIRVNPLFFY